MADVYQEQARFFANVPLMQSGVVASIHFGEGLLSFPAGR